MNGLPDINPERGELMKLMKHTHQILNKLFFKTPIG
jgi:hypothetical protein